MEMLNNAYQILYLGALMIVGVGLVLSLIRKLDPTCCS